MSLPLTLVSVALVPLTPGGAGISETVSGAALVGLGVWLGLRARAASRRDRGR